MQPQAGRSGATPVRGVCRLIRSWSVHGGIAVALTILWPLSSTPIGAQGESRTANPAAPFYWSVDVGVTALSAWLQGRSAGTSLPRALLAGVIGGSLMYAGQRAVGTGNSGLRLVGVETVALGANVGRNMGRGVPALSDLTFPVFPFYVRIRAHRTPVVSVRLSTLGVIGGIRMASKYRTGPDLMESLLSGALVTRVPGGDLHCYGGDEEVCNVNRVGEHLFGAIAYADDPDPCPGSLIVAHEMVHVAQDARDGVLHAVEVSDRALPALGSFGRWVSRYLVIDLFVPFMPISWMVGPPAFDDACRGVASFYECEAEAMLWRRTCTGTPAGAGAFAPQLLRGDVEAGRSRR